MGVARPRMSPQPLHEDSCEATPVYTFGAVPPSPSVRTTPPPSVPPSPCVPPHAAPVGFRRVSSLVNRFQHTRDASKLVFVMVGLPARGKSFISMRLARFLQWIGLETLVFNVGSRRRSCESGLQDASYFDPHVGEAVARREQIALDVLQELIAWLEASNSDRCAIFDATNSTRARRKKVAEIIRAREGIGLIFVESICTDAAVIEANLLLKLGKSPDYASIPAEEARQDLLRRIWNYERVYETVEDEELFTAGRKVNISYIKLLNLSSHVVAHNIWGRTANTVLPYLMAMHVGSRPVWLVRMPHAEMTPGLWRKRGRPWPAPAEVQFSEQPPSEEGLAFVEAVSEFAVREAPSIAVFSSTHRRALDLAQRFAGSRARTSLNPQDRGVCDGLTTREIMEQAPEVWADPMHKRFLGGENLADLLHRLGPTLTEIEQEMRPVLVVAPLSALQVLYCYYSEQPVERAFTVALPMHTVIELRPNGGKFTERRLTMQDLCTDMTPP